MPGREKIWLPFLVLSAISLGAPNIWQKTGFLACWLSATVLPHKQQGHLALSAGTGAVAQTTGDDRLDPFQVASGDEFVAVASQPLPAGKRMNQVSKVPKHTGVWRQQSLKAMDGRRGRSGKKDKLWQRLEEDQPWVSPTWTTQQVMWGTLTACSRL